MSESEIWIGNIYKSIEFICPYCKKDFGNTSNMTIEEKNKADTTTAKNTALVVEATPAQRITA